MLFADLILRERGQRTQAQVEDRLGLLLAQRERAHQLGARLIDVGAATDDRDHAIDVVQRDQVALEDVRAPLGPVEPELRAARDHLALVIDVVAEHRLQPERLGLAIDQTDHVRAERRLQGRVLVELVEHDLRHLAALQLDRETHAVAIGLVDDVADARDHLVLHELDDLDDHPIVAALLHHVGQLGDDDRVVAALLRLDVRDRAHADATTARVVRIADALQPHHDRARREVGALDVLHQALGRDRRIVDQGDGRVDDLAEVVRRDVRRHADRDAGRAVHEQVREARGQHRRKLLSLVVVRLEVDDVLVEIAQHLRRDVREPRLGVAHRRRCIAIDVAEVALAVDERVARAELLREAHERVVDRLVAVRVEVAHALADDLRALDVGAVRLQPELVHREEHAPVHRLEAVAHVGQRTPDDHAHRIVEVRRAHLLDQLARLDVAVAQFHGAHSVSPVRHRGT